MKSESLLSDCGSFIPVKMQDLASVCQAGCVSGMASCEVVYPNGVTVRMPSGMTLGQLRQMVTLLS